MAQSKDLIAALKAALKAQGLTYADVARRLKISEATVKRMFARGTFSLDRLDQLCEFLNMELSDLSELALERTPKLTMLSREQEEALLKDRKLLFIAYLALGHWRFEEILAAYDFSEPEAIRLLIRLDRLGLIQLLPGNRIKLLTTHNFSWRPDGAVKQFLENEVLPEFLRSSFQGTKENMKFIGGLLSQASMQRFQQSLDKLVKEFDELIEDDSRLPLEERHSFAALLAARPWQFSQFAKFQRRKIKGH